MRRLGKAEDAGSVYQQSIEYGVRDMVAQRERIASSWISADVGVSPKRRHPNALTGAELHCLGLGRRQCCWGKDAEFVIRNVRCEPMGRLGGGGVWL